MVETILGIDIYQKDNDIQFSTNQDFAQIRYLNNLKQAIYNRLSTYKGEYFVEEYGSELYKVIGQPYSILTKNRIIGFVKEAILQEPRVSEILEVKVEIGDSQDKLLLYISVLPIEATIPLNLVYPLFL